MSAEKFKRKLTAILSADVKGYSRLMGTDEEATLRTLKEYKEVMASSIQHHRGRIVGTAGDSVLAEFASVVDAVQCAVEIQQVLRAKNSLLPENRRMEFRIGINLGDVIEEGGYDLRGWGEHCGPDGEFGRGRGHLHIRECLPADREQATAPIRLHGGA